MPRTFYDDVHARAKPRFEQANGAFTADNVHQYENFYLEAAREIRDELNAEGLVKSAEKLQDMIDFTEGLARSRAEQKLKTEQAKIWFDQYIADNQKPIEPKPLDEDVLPDNYPMYADFTYVVDGVVTLNHLHGISVFGYKQKTGAGEVRRCDIYGRLEQKRRGK